MPIDTLRKVKNYNSQKEHYEAPYLSPENMEDIEYALEKQVPKKPQKAEIQPYFRKHYSQFGYGYVCPVCKSRVDSKQKFCSQCGQKIGE